MFHVCAVWNPDERLWFAEVHASTGEVLHRTSLADSELKARRLAAEWIDTHCDLGSCCC